MIAIVDYRVGNVQSVLYALSRLDQDSTLTSDPSEIESADGVILPGVGAFAAARDDLRERGLDEVLCGLAEDGRPILGICLGLQLFFSESHEHGTHRGLDLFDGVVDRFQGRTKVPHMGWNQVIQAQESPLWAGVENESFFYFAHSYFVQPEDADVVIGRADYEGEFVCAVEKENVFGLQFHPEKCGEVGERFLAIFCRFAEESN